MHSVRLFLGLFVLCGTVASVTLSAQVPTSIGRGRGGSGSFDPTNDRRGGVTEQRQIGPDTFGLYYFTVDNPNEETQFADTLLNEFQQYDPTRTRDIDYAHQGILGSAAYPLAYTGRDRRGFDLGWHAYDLYRVTGENLRFYRLQRPSTKIDYVIGSEQEDGYIRSRFTRNFADGLNFVLNFNRFAQLGQQDQYPRQNLRTTNFATGFQLRRKRYQGFASFSANTFQQQHNGGVRELPVIDEEIDEPGSALVFLNEASSRLAHRELMLTQYLRYGGTTDSLGKRRRAFTIAHQLRWENSTYRTSAPLQAADTFFYQRFPALLVDFRGARSFVQHRSLDNTFSLSTFRLSAADDGGPRTQRDRIELGITHRYNRVSQEPVDSVINNLLLYGKIGLRPGERLRLQLEGQLALLDQVGDYRLNGLLYVDLKKAGRLEVRLRNQLYTPAYLTEQFYLTQEPIWQRQFDRTLETNLEGSYTIPGLNIELAGGYHLLTNYIYFDSTSLPQQTGELLNIVQLSAAKNFRFGRFQLHNRILLQTSPQDRIPLPRLFGKHSFFYDGTWFQVLNVRLGVDVRYTDSFQPYYYNPLSGQFQLQGRQTVTTVPATDLFFAMRVTRFRFFAKYENFHHVWAPQDFLYLSAFAPYPDGAVRLGISWQLID